LAKASHWENPEKADRLLFETQARRSTEIWNHDNDLSARCRILNNVERTAEDLIDRRSFFRRNNYAGTQRICTDQGRETAD
jgi:hypothetical protein